MKKNNAVVGIVIGFLYYVLWSFDKSSHAFVIAILAGFGGYYWEVLKQQK